VELGLTGKVCIVTGSTSGIGLHVAQQLHDDGAVVVTSGRRPDGIGDLHVAGDLTEPGAPEQLVAKTVERCAPPARRCR
jgi:3-oxoacyl-[acyl-carrier protein] reductase